MQTQQDMTAVESLRGCGYRKVGGYYFISGPGGETCHRLPEELHRCPICDSGFKPSLGFTWIDARTLFGPPCISAGRHSSSSGFEYADDAQLCTSEEHRISCAICAPHAPGEDPLKRCGLIWIGGEHYSVEDFVREERQMGACRRIPMPPRDFEIGKTFVVLAHRKCPFPEGEPHQGAFMLWCPQRLEKLVWEDEAEKVIKGLEKQGITVVKIPRSATAHAPKERKKSNEKS